MVYKSVLGIDINRRGFVLGGATFAALSAAGCCTVPSQQISGGCNPMPSPFLAGPEVMAAWAKSVRYFDAHTHFFNAADVPVREFLAKSVAHSITSEQVRKLVIALAPVAEALAHLAPTPSLEMGQLCRGAGIRGQLLLDQTLELDDAIAKRNQDTADEVYREILRRSPGIPSLVNDVAQRARNARPGLSSVERPPFSQEFVREVLRNGAARGDAIGVIRPQIVEALTVEELDYARIQNAFQFVGFMLSPRHHNLRTYIRRFAEHSPSVPLSGCFAAMVDFNYWLDCPDKASNIRDQVLVHEQLALLSRGFVMPLVAYNPWVDIQEKDAAIKTVEWAIKDHGCVGVKIYPPMGFFPYGNEGNPLSGTTEKRPDLKLLDEKLANLYAMCDKLGVPVMAHANESNGRDNVHDKLAGAVGWEAARTKLTQMSELHVNAGHFGGALARADSDWNADFVKLMGEKGPLKVYADLGYWDELLTSRKARDRLKQDLLKTLSLGDLVADRTMYGSDWLMLSQVPGWESYADGVAKVLRGYDTSGDIAERVLGVNVLKCYGLTQASSRGNFERIKGYYASSGLRGLPGWM